jgi:hypothetical protein
MAVKTYFSKYGRVFHSTTCKDDFKNIKTRPPFDGEPNTGVTLQASALRSLRAVERSLGGPFKPRHIRVTGSIRSCEQQYALWRTDPGRFAHPDTTLHTQGLAIDVYNTPDSLNNKVRKALLAHGWHQSRPDDEPWHFSFRLTA